MTPVAAGDKVRGHFVMTEEDAWLAVMASGSEEVSAEVADNINGPTWQGVWNAVRDPLVHSRFWYQGGINQ